MKIVNKAELLRKCEALNNTIEDHHERFVEGIAAAEFGGRYWGWREWADHVDVEPDTIAEQRKAAIWGGSK